MDRYYIPKECKEITLAVLRDPRLHWKSCYEDIAGRPDFNCICPIKKIMDEIQDLPEIKDVKK